MSQEHLRIKRADGTYDYIPVNQSDRDPDWINTLWERINNSNSKGGGSGWRPIHSQSVIKPTINPGQVIRTLEECCDDLLDQCMAYGEIPGEFGQDLGLALIGFAQVLEHLAAGQIETSKVELRAVFTEILNGFAHKYMHSLGALSDTLEESQRQLLLKQTAGSDKLVRAHEDSLLEYAGMIDAFTELVRELLEHEAELRQYINDEAAQMKSWQIDANPEIPVALEALQSETHGFCETMLFYKIEPSSCNDIEAEVASAKRHIATCERVLSEATQVRNQHYARAKQLYLSQAYEDDLNARLEQMKVLIKKLLPGPQTMLWDKENNRFVEPGLCKDYVAFEQLYAKHKSPLDEHNRFDGLRNDLRRLLQEPSFGPGLSEVLKEAGNYIEEFESGLYVLGEPSEEELAEDFVEETNVVVVPKPSTKPTTRNVRSEAAKKAAETRRSKEVVNISEAPSSTQLEELYQAVLIIGLTVCNSQSLAVKRLFPRSAFSTLVELGMVEESDRLTLGAKLEELIISRAEDLSHKITKPSQAKSRQSKTKKDWVVFPQAVYSRGNRLKRCLRLSQVAEQKAVDGAAALGLEINAVHEAYKRVKEAEVEYYKTRKAQGFYPPRQDEFGAES